MRFLHFADKELNEELKKRFGDNDDDEPSSLEEHRFIASCLQINLSIQDLKELEYKDVLKILLCYSDLNSPHKEGNISKRKKATQDDWDRLMS